MKEDTREVLGRVERLTAEIERNPLTKKLRADEAAETLAKRTAAAAKITDLQIDMEATGVLMREVNELAAKLAGMDRERQELQARIAATRGAYAMERTGISGEIRQQEIILLSCYNSRIDEEISYFRERFEALRKRTANHQSQAESNIETKTITTFSNAGSLRRALAYCTAAVRQLEAMRLEPVFDPAKIERLRAEEPDADLLEEFSATKGRYNDEARPGLLSAIRRATDDLSDLTVGTLLEKAKKILATPRPKKARA